MFNDFKGSMQILHAPFSLDRDSNFIKMLRYKFKEMVQQVP